MTQKTLWCQQYDFDFNDMRIADFADSMLDSYIQFVFESAETGIGPGDIKVNLGEYRFSQAIAEIVEEHGFSGMIIPGVRGARDCRYKNMVVFSPEPRWKQWVNNAVQPQKLFYDPPGRVQLLEIKDLAVNALARIDLK